MTKPNITEYDKKAVYESEIKPLLLQIRQVCIQNNLPFFAGFTTANTASKTTYVYDTWTADEMGIVLTDDHMQKHLCVANGFDVKPHGLEDIFAAVVQTSESVFANVEEMGTEPIDDGT